MFDEAIEALTQMNESYKNLRKENTQMYFELSYLKQAIKELGLEETIENKIKQIKDEEFPF